LLKLTTSRLLTMIPILLGIILITQLLLTLMPGDPAKIMAGDAATPEAVQQIRTDLHLDEPVWERFGIYVDDLAHGNLGREPGSETPVSDRIAPALPVTLSLAGVAMVFAVVLGLGGGALAALRSGRFADRAVTTTASLVQAVPPFVVGLGLVVFLAVDRAWLPASGYVSFGEDPWQWLQHLILPAVTLSLASAAELARQTRGALIDTLEQDFIRACRAKGLRERRVVGKHAAKNAATPVVTVLGLQVGRILGGAVLVELIFGLPGFGALALTAVQTRDVVLIQAVVLISAVAVLLANLIVDMAYGYLNPKVRT
jgi:peptide/nickel transport system permease protein